ncbi:MAG: biotin/lipoyl-containing protein, partial [Nitriliruptoraceae bacterium]
MTEFPLPDVGEGLAEAEVVRWLVAPGEPVTADQEFVEVETDKAIVGITSPVTGVLVRHGAAEGEIVAVGALLAVLDDGADGAGDAASPATAVPDPGGGGASAAVRMLPGIEAD